MKIFLVRHASAVDRHFWEGEEIDRPLDDIGKTQSQALIERFSHIEISSVLSSGAARCKQTIWPTSIKCKKEVQEVKALFEGSGMAAEELIATILKKNDPESHIILCSHGDVISEIVRTLVLRGMQVSGKRGFAKASVWELICTKEKIIEGIYHPPPFDE